MGKEKLLVLLFSLIDGLLRDFSLAEGTGPVVLEPVLDAVVVEVVPRVTWQRYNLHFLRVVSKTDAALAGKRVLIRVVLTSEK